MGNDNHVLVNNVVIPMAVISKYREKTQDVKHYSKISVIIPAYNEEKVITHTIEGLLETKYPNKEIIFVNDGSTDNTLSIAMQYNYKRDGFSVKFLASHPEDYLFQQKFHTCQIIRPSNDMIVASSNFFKRQSQY